MTNDKCGSLELTGLWLFFGARELLGMADLPLVFWRSTGVLGLKRFFGVIL